MKRLRTTLLLSFGLASVTICLAMLAFILGLIPDSHKAELDARAKVAEALAVQLAGSVSRNDGTAIEETLAAVVERNPDIRSVAFRRIDGTISPSRGDHAKYWVEPAEGMSTPTHVFVPLVGPDGPQGQIEIAFDELASGGRFFDIPISLFVLLGFLAVAGFLTYTIFLRRALHELDPGRVIPERVQKAFDTLSEGVIILDERERILLVNASFASMYGKDLPPPVGSNMNSMSWRTIDGGAKAGGYPWHTALREGREDVLSLRTPDGAVRNLNVNATVFSGEKNETIGAIVTLTDMTESTRSAEQLSKAVELLQQTQKEVERQKQELDYLSNHDTLTGCLNRRSFLAHFETGLEQARRQRQPVAVLMVDIDGLRNIKKNFGPAVTDSLIATAANTLRTNLPADFLLARYGGEGFCVAVYGQSQDGIFEIVRVFQSAFADATRSTSPGPDYVTLGVGVSRQESESHPATELMRRADEALNIAMGEGPGRIAWWNDTATYVNLTQEIPAMEADTDEQHQGPEQAKGHLEQWGFLDRATRSIALASRDERPLAILKIGVTSWDYFEEALGEELSQILLRLTKRQVELSLREHDNVVLLPETGELLVELPELDQPDDVTWIAKRIQDSFRDPLKVGEQSIYVICKIGAALFPNDGTSASELSRHAGIALRRALQENRVDGLKFYNAEMTQTSFRNLDIETGTRAALQSGEFELVFQPIIGATDGSLRAAETLLRCTSSRLNGVRIDQIIDVAERSSLIAEIDMWVLTAALEQMAAWDNVGLHLPKISINISAKQFTNAEFIDSISEKIAAAPFSPARIQVEVTETARMTDVDVAAPQLKRLQQLGVYIALDDFGTGQASLTYLQRLHPDLIKIDRSFVDGLHRNHASATMVSAMTVMAHCLGLKVVAEGVETEEELNFLRDIGCDEVQGYLISKPLPVNTMTDWMKLFAAKTTKRAATTNETVEENGSGTAAGIRAA